MTDSPPESSDEVQRAEIDLTSLERSEWPLERTSSDLVSEALVADYLLGGDPQTRWLGGNHRGVDVYSGYPEGLTESQFVSGEAHARATIRVDAKHCSAKTARIEGVSQHVISLFAKPRLDDGGNLLPHARDMVTHFGLVILDHEASDAGENKITVASPTVRTVSTFILRAMYIVPSRVINDPSIFKRHVNQTTGNEYGNSLMATLVDVEPFLVADTEGVRDSTYPVPV